MTPSAEIRLLQQARESARTEAEASGSGRRARAPSLKFLEAAGLVENEGAQWMTKEIKEAEAKRVKDLREQRKQYKAAGLKSGEVIEAYSAPTASAGGVVSVNSGGARGGIEQIGVKELPADKHNWRKVAPAEVLKQAGGRQSLAWVALKAGKATASAQDRDMVTPARSANESVNKRKGAPSDGKSSPTTSSRSADVKSSKTSKRSRQSKHQDGGKRRGGKRAASTVDVERGLNREEKTMITTTCEFQSCRKRATFGVNGAVRYW